MGIKKTATLYSNDFIGLKSYFDIAGHPGKFSALDGLRAIAIILVLLRHGLHVNGFNNKHGVWNLWYNGWLGVDLFFILSGFLITYHLLNNWPKEDSFQFVKLFFAKRALRILPLYITIIFLVWAGFIPFYHPHEPITIDIIFKHIIFVQEYFFSTIIVTLWSLGIEEKFYLLAPILTLITSRVRPAITLLVIALLVSGVFFYKQLYIAEYNPKNYSDYFWNIRAPFQYASSGIILGCAIGIIKAKLNTNIWIKTRAYYFFWICFGVISFILLISPWVERSNWQGVDAIIFLASLLFALMVYFAIHSEKLELGILGGYTLRLIAKISYPLYICHITVIPAALKLIPISQVNSGQVGFLLFFVLYIALSFVFAITLHLLIEKPFLLIKDSLVSRG